MFLNGEQGEREAHPEGSIYIQSQCAHAARASDFPKMTGEENNFRFCM